MKFCVNCGKAMDDNYSVCPYCGVQAPQEGEAPKTNTPPTDSTGAESYSQNQQSYFAYNQTNTESEIPEYIPAPRPKRSAYVAAFLALFFGVFGLHDFYLDRKTKGLIKLLVSLFGCGIGAVIIQVLSIIDALKLLKGEINVDGKGEMIKMGF